MEILVSDKARCVELSAGFVVREHISIRRNDGKEKWGNFINQSVAV
jgi:hypothetical protein